MPRIARDRTGEIHGKLTVLHRLGSRNRSVEWLCMCECGEVVVKLSSHLNGNCSCGCGRVKHGHAKDGFTPTYTSWDSMKARCSRESHPNYMNYGGRGIDYCDEWEDFAQFLADMGERPEGKTLDRIDNDKGYSPSNCRWSTPEEQQLNRRICYAR